MDLINMFMNIVFPPLSIFALLFVLPPYLFFKYLHTAIRTVFSEDVAGKVVLIAGASSGIGEHLAYEYARRRACLALVARRENRLEQVAAIAKELGALDVIFIPGDVSKIEDCEGFVNATVRHFGRLDHLVTNAGIAPVSMFEQIPDITKMAPAMDINFWGSVYSSHFAIPHLKRSRGKIIVVGSCASWLTPPRMGIYNASKAALVNMYETLRIELGSEIGITIVNPGLIKSEMTEGKFLNQQGRLEMDKEMRDVEISVMPLESTMECAKAIVRATCRGDKYLTEPAWYRAMLYFKVFLPDVQQWSNRFFLIPRPGHSDRDTISKKLLDVLREIKGFLTPNIDTVEFAEYLTPHNGDFLHHAD
ncbi:11-beta-hydroxysteroid dehydrogenase A-like [Mercurialis annua]|uniref:11-beta-hydroxysteroid dehydrogenase A-like n=1 Tax=Mercurialis annua TaxID=3986 RepID=UPI00215E78AE|nr:11-beta-hydroxysteroid dehydrogenase A-like [Mercurialis annua]